MNLASQREFNDNLGILLTVKPQFENSRFCFADFGSRGHAYKLRDLTHSADDED